MAYGLWFIKLVNSKENERRSKQQTQGEGSIFIGEDRSEWGSPAVVHRGDCVAPERTLPRYRGWTGRWERKREEEELGRGGRLQERWLFPEL